jgi:ATP-dependent helicase HrpA
VRDHSLGDLDEVMAEFYARHLSGVSSIEELNGWLREPGAQERLCITEAELAGGRLSDYDSAAFPDAIPLGGQPVALAYAYAPGEEHDGVTVELPFSLAQTASAALIEWAVPGLRAEIIQGLLRALPKSLRRGLMPLAPKVDEIVRDFRPRGTSFLADLAVFLQRRYGVPIKASDWPTDALPAHLRPRIAIVDHEKKPLGTGRDLAQLRERLRQTEPAPAPTDSALWARAALQWERFALTDWTFGDLPERITVSEVAGLAEHGWPGIEHVEGVVNVRLFRDSELARSASLHGVRRLVELAVQKELAWLERDLRGLSRLDALYAPLGDSAELRETALEHLKRYILPNEPLPALTRAGFETAVTTARQRLPGLAMQFIDRLGLVLQMRWQVQQRLNAVASPQPPRPRTLSSLSQLGAPPVFPAVNPLAAELAGLVPARFLERIEYDRLPHLPRYLKALLIRAERAALNPAKNQDRLRQLSPYLDALKKLQAQSLGSLRAARQTEVFRWLVEEFKVSLFAQELGTAVPVSPKRLDQQLEKIREAG